MPCSAVEVEYDIALSRLSLRTILLYGVEYIHKFTGCTSVARSTRVREKEFDRIDRRLDSAPRLNFLSYW